MAKDLWFEKSVLESGNSIVVTPSGKVEDVVIEAVAMRVWSVLEISWWHGAGENPWFQQFDREYAKVHNCQP